MAKKCKKGFLKRNGICKRLITLTTVEKRGTKIIHKKAKTKAVIIGSYRGGFVVYVPKEKKKLRLPFQKVDNFDVIK